MKKFSEILNALHRRVFQASHQTIHNHGAPRKQSDIACDAELSTGLKTKPGSTQLAYLVSALAGGNLLSAAIRTVSGILTARLIEPSLLGLFSGIGLVLGYAPFFQLGIANGLNRELPYFVGKGERDRANELAAAAQSWMLLIGILSAIVLMTIAGYHLFQGKHLETAGWGAHAVLIFFFFYSSFYLQITFRTTHDFARLAMINVVEAAFGLVFLLLVWLMSFYGLCLRAVLLALISTAIFYNWRPLRVGPRWNYGHLKHLFVIGAPIFAVGQIYAWWFVIDKTLVLFYTGTHGLGLFAMVTMTSGMMQLLPSSLSNVIYPRMAEQFGRGSSTAELCRMAIKPMILSVISMAFLAAIAWWLVEPAVNFIVPKYIEAVPAMKWALLSPIVMSFAPVNNIFNVVRRQGLYLAAILFGMAVYGASLMWLIRDGVSLVAFPQAMLVGSVAFILTCQVIIFFMQRSKEGDG